MKNSNRGDWLLIGGAIVAFAALGFLTGFIVGGRRKKQMVVTEKGELQEVEQE